MNKISNKILSHKNISFNAIDSEQIIESLPGMFYLYEKIKNQFYLKFWNKNHEKITGYTADELLNKKVLDFFYQKDKKVIIEGLKELLASGKVKQMYSNLKLKNKTTIPFIFEGHLLRFDNRIFFTGQGIDVSLYSKEKLNVKKIGDQLFLKEKELLSNIIENKKNTTFINNISRKVNKILLKDSILEIKKELFKLNSEILYMKTEFDNWAIFKSQFKSLHPDFFNSLKFKHPKLTKNDIKYLSYLKLNLNFNQIESLLNISKEGIKKRRYRIKKKLNLKNNLSLDDYINDI